jgi:non-heme chloroperoxidase
MAFLRMRDGRSIYVRVLGRGTPCLLVHGFGADSRSWLPFVAPLAHRYRFILPDLRGFGQSHHVPIAHDCPLTGYAEDIADTLCALEIDTLPVGGISMGAFVCVQAFRVFGGHRFSRYLHIDQGPAIHNRPDYAHGMMGPAQAAFFARLRALVSALDPLRAQCFEELPRGLREEFFSTLGEFSAAAFTSPLMQRLVRTAAHNEPLMRRVFAVEHWQTYLHIVRAYLERDYDMREGFRAIRVPMTVLIGGASRMYPPEGQRQIASLAPHAAVCEIPNSGHNLPVEAPARFFRALSGFLKAESDLTCDLSQATTARS